MSRNRKSQQPTMAELAAELGLSRMSVSSAINGKGRRIGLSKKTIRRVRDHLKQRGYVPSRYATALKPDPTQIIGLLHFGKLFSHLTEAFNLLIEALSAPGRRIEIMAVPLPTFADGVRELMARRVSDLVWIHNGRIGEDYKKDEIAGYLSNVNTIIYNYGFGDWGSEQELLTRGFHLVGTNRLTGVSRLAGFLHNLGHRKILLPGVRLKDKDTRFPDRFIDAGIELHPCREGRLLPEDRKSAVKCATAIRTAMKSKRVTAAVFLGDEAACRVIIELHRMGIRVPEDLTVIGFDGVSHRWVFSPSLTTLRIPVPEMVQRVRDIVSGDCQSHEHCFNLELLKEETHGPPGSTGPTHRKSLQKRRGRQTTIIGENKRGGKQ